MHYKPTTSLRLIWVIAKSTYKEIIRDRLMYGILIVALLVTASSFFLATISVGQDPRVIQNVGLASILLFSTLIAVFVTTTSIHHDFERRALYLLFPKPISRTQYALGKYVGIVLILLTTLIILGGVLALGVSFTHAEVLSNIAINLGFAFLEVSFLIALAELFASFTGQLNATLYTLAFFIIGHSLATVKQYIEGMTVSPFVVGMVKGAYYLLPNFEKFNVRSATLYHVPISSAQVLWAVLYWALYTVIVLYLAVQITRKQEV
jgi:ABC-type transport system involved in multi-copper enzyme maturation permease subunit